MSRIAIVFHSGFGHTKVLAEQVKAAGVKELPIILKGDVQGSVEVLADMLGKMSTEKVKIKVLHASVGAITETDVLLASASDDETVRLWHLPDLP